MLRSSLLAICVICLPCAQPVWAAAGGCQVMQTLSRDGQIRDLAVSPSGNQLAVATDQGVFFYSLDSNGGMHEGPAAGNLHLPGTRRIAFTPSGGRLLIALEDSWLYWWERNAKTAGGSMHLGVAGYTPQGLFVLEDPSLLFLKGQLTGDVLVLDYRRFKTKPVETIPMASSSYAWGGSVVASADASMVFWTAGTEEPPTRYLLYAEPYKSSGAVWTYPLSGVPTALCVGPDPAHLLLTTAGTNTGLLQIFRQTAAEDPLLGCVLGSFRPSHMAFSNDGYYAVLVSYSSRALRAVSGHDLRARLDPAVAMSADGVRTDQVDVGCDPSRVALHPTKPIAYVGANSPKGIVRVQIAIPGIEHPLAQ